MAQSKIDGVMEKHFDEYESTEFAGLVRALEAGEEPTRQAVSAELSAVLEMEMPEDDVVVDDILGLFKKGKKSPSTGAKGKGKKEGTNASPQTPPAKAKKEKKAKAIPTKTESEPEEETNASPETPPSKEKVKKEKKAKATPSAEGSKGTEASPSEPEASDAEAPPKEKAPKKSKATPAKTESEPSEAPMSPPRKRNEVSEFTRLVSMTMKGMELHGSEIHEYLTVPTFKEGSKSRETAANLELFAKFQNKKLSLKEVVESTVKAIEEAEEKVKIVVVSAIVRGFFQKEDREAMLAKASLPEPEGKAKRVRKSKKETEA